MNDDEFDAAARELAILIERTIQEQQQKLAALPAFREGHQIRRREKLQNAISTTELREQTE